MGIPKRDEIGRKIENGDVVTLFSNDGLYYTGKVLEVEGKRVFEICKGSWIHSIGELRMMKDGDANG